MKLCRCKSAPTLSVFYKNGTLFGYHREHLQSGSVVYRVRFGIHFNEYFTFKEKEFRSCFEEVLP